MLDQRTFECHWQTLVKLAEYKKQPQNKIELLYFLGVGWLHRAFSGLKDQQIAEKWWGRSDWDKLHKMTCWSIADLMRTRFINELGYRFSAAYPIYDRDEGNRSRHTRADRGARRATALSAALLTGPEPHREGLV